MENNTPPQPQPSIALRENIVPVIVVDHSQFPFERSARPIGRGIYAKVYKTTVDNEIFAVKSIKACHKDAAIREFYALCQLVGHPNVISINRAFVRGYGYYPKIAIEMPYIDQKLTNMLIRLKDMLGPEKSADDNRAVIGVMCDVLHGLEWIHSRGFIHGDIKPDNILIDSSTLRAVICDFSIVSPIDETYHSWCAYAGYWRPPELVFAPSKQPVKYNEKADVYAAGWTLYSIFTGDENPPHTLGKTNINTIIRKFYGISASSSDTTALRDLENIDNAHCVQKIVNLCDVPEFALPAVNIVANCCVPNQTARYSASRALDELYSAYSITPREQPQIARREHAPNEKLYEIMKREAWPGIDPKLLALSTRICASILKRYPTPRTKRTCRDIADTSLRIAAYIYGGTDFDRCGNDNMITEAIVHHDWV